MNFIRILFTAIVILSSSFIWAQGTALPEKKVKTKTANIGETTSASSESAASPEKDKETLKFNTDSISEKKEVRESIPFKFEENRKSINVNSEELPPEDGAFIAYPGYPKHQIEVDLLPTQVGSTWSYSGQDYNYNSSSSSSFGVAYRYISTPRMNFTFDYSRYEVSIKNATVTPYSIAESKATVDNYGVKSQFCHIMQGSFFQQFCGGIDLGVESYPLLDFTGSTTLQLGKVQDIILGLNIGYNHPLAGGLILKTKLGYNYGTGSGSSGALTPKANNALYAKADIEWMVYEHHGLNFGAEYKNRHAEVKGKRGTNTDQWKSTITTTAFKAGYIYTF